MSALAVWLSLYGISECHLISNGHFIATFQAGYQTVCPLLEAELAALPALIVGRIALSLTNGAYAAQNNPSNAEYVLITQRPGWSLLTELMQPDNEQLAVLVRQITAKAGCGV